MGDCDIRVVYGGTDFCDLHVLSDLCSLGVVDLRVNPTGAGSPCHLWFTVYDPNIVSVYNI